MLSLRKLAVAFFLVSALVTTGYSQGFSFGPKVGLNVSNYTGGDIKSDALVGAHFGGLLNFGFGKAFSIQPEVLFSTQGAKIESGTKKEEFKVNYISVPVMLKLKTGSGIYLEAGPQFSFKSGEKIGDQTFNKFANSMDLAAGVGLGYQSNIGLGIGARYVAGISKVGDFDGQNIDPDFKNSVIQVSVFWAIPTSKR